MKKKILMCVCAVLFILPCIFMLTACDFGKEPPVTYVVQFYNYDGTLIKEISIEENSFASCEIPTKDSTQYYVYEFSNWEFLDGTDATEELASVKKTLAVRAKFNEVQPTYTINFYDEDGETVFHTEEVLRGESLTLPTDLTKSDDYFNYSLDKLEDFNGEAIYAVTDVRGNISVYVSWSKTRHSYSVNYYDDDKSTLLKTVPIRIGEYHNYGPSNPEKPDWTFIKWHTVDGVEYHEEPINSETNLYAFFVKNIVEEADITYEFDSSLFAYTVANANKTNTSHNIKADISGFEVVKIKKYAFEGAELSTITIPSTIKEIGSSAFGSCLGIETVNYMGDINGWVSINFVNALSNPLRNNSAILKISGNPVTSLQDVTVSEIKKYAFNGYRHFTELTFSKSITKVGSGVFEYCTNLTCINYLGDIDSWSTIEFSAYKSNPLSNGATLKLNGDIVTQTVISVPVISDYAFIGCSSIEEVTFENTVDKIGVLAFAECTNLKKVTISSGETIFGSNAFKGSENIVEVIFLEDINAWVGINFQYEYSNPLMYGKASLKIDGSVVTHANITTAKVIQNYVFTNYKKLTEVTLPSVLTTVVQSAFEGCTNIEVVNYLGDINSWSTIYFSSVGASSEPVNPLQYGAILKIAGEEVTTAEIDPKSSSALCHYTFFNYIHLTTVKIGSRVLNMQTTTFKGCSNLTTIIIDSSSVAEGLTSENSEGYLISNANIIYVKKGLQVGSYVESVYTDVEEITTGEYAGYICYSKN